MNDTAATKAQRVAEAAKARAKAEQETEVKEHEANEKRNENLREAAEQRAEVKPQAINGTLEGKIDVNAMGDVKGDGRDAKDYPNDDPDKALGVPVYEHGLKETSVGGETPATEKVLSKRLSAKTEAEMNRGKEIVGSRERSAPKAKASETRTVVTDADDDPDGEKGRKAAEDKKASK